MLLAIFFKVNFGLFNISLWYNNTNVGINANATTNNFLNLCINAGAFIRVEIVSTFGNVLGTFNSAPFAPIVNVPMAGIAPGLYFLRISAIGCPNNGVYQETHQVQKL